MDDTPFDTEFIRNELTTISLMVPAELYASVWEHIACIVTELKKFEHTHEPPLPEEFLLSGTLPPEG